MVHVTVGQSWHQQAHEAGRQAAQAAVAERMRSPYARARRAVLALVFASTHYAQPSLAQAISQVIGPQTPVVGCSSAGQLTAKGVATHSVAVMVFWAGAHLSALPVFAANVSADPEAAGQQLGHSVLQQIPHASAITSVTRATGRVIVTRPYTLLLLADSRAGNIATVIESASHVLGPAFQIVGGLAGDDYRLAQSYQYLNGAVLQDAVVGVVLVSRGPAAVGVCHGCRPCSDSMMVTRADGAVLHELDGRPAMDVFHSQFGSLPANSAADRSQPLAQNKVGPTFPFLSAWQHPIGIPELNGAYRLRHPLHAAHDGAIVFAASVPQGMAVKWMTCSPTSAVAAARQAARDAVEGLGRARPAAAMIFSSSAKWLDGDTAVAEQELQAIRDVIGRDVPIIGLATSGELAATHSFIPELHNQMCLVFLIGV